jgi:hypothetical protein
MAQVASTTTNNPAVVDLTPPGGTPFFRMFRCCVPSTSTTAATVPRTRQVSFEEQQRTEVGGLLRRVSRDPKLSSIEEETFSGIAREGMRSTTSSSSFSSAENGETEFDALPDLDDTEGDDASLNNNNIPPPNDMLLDLWRLFMSIIFLGLMGGTPSRRAIKAQTIPTTSASHVE